MGRFIRAPIFENEAENCADQLTRGMELWDISFTVSSMKAILLGEEIEHRRRLRREQTARARAKKKAK